MLQQIIQKAVMICNSANDNKQAWRHNYMSGTHTAKFLLCHYLLTLMGGEVWVGGDIIT